MSGAMTKEEILKTVDDLLEEFDGRPRAVQVDPITQEAIRQMRMSWGGDPDEPDWY